MAKQPRKAKPSKKRIKEKPLSLYGMDFGEALDRLLAAKPVKKSTAKRRS